MSDRHFMEMAISVSKNSADRSRKVGAVIVSPEGEVISIGWNAFPRGVIALDERFERPEKYLWTEHAERSAIYAAARKGVSTQGCTIYVPWFPCMDCARGIVLSGICRLVALKPDVADEKWGEHFIAALKLFEECGVVVSFIDQ